MLINLGRTLVAIVHPYLELELMKGGLRFAASKGQHEALTAVGAAA